MNISTHDVIVRHIRIRPGAGNRAKTSGWEVDGLSTVGGAHDVIVDHCSLTWSTDENLSASAALRRCDARRMAQNTSPGSRSASIVAEGLHDSTHAKGPHSMGSLIHDNTSDIAIIGNLYLSNNARNPLFKGGARGAVVNNLIHNPGSRIVTYGLVPSEWEGHPWLRGAMVVVGNVARKGASTVPNVAFVEARGPCDVYLADNLYFGDGKPLPASANLRDVKGQPPGGDPPTDPPRQCGTLLAPRVGAPTRNRAWVLANAVPARGNATASTAVSWTSENRAGKSSLRNRGRGRLPLHDATLVCHPRASTGAFPKLIRPLWSSIHACCSSVVGVRSPRG